MKKFIAIYLFISLVFLSTAQAQFPLPIYEEYAPDEYFLLRVDSIPKKVKKQFDTLSMLRQDEQVAYLRFTNFRLINKKECCHDDSTFLVGKLNPYSIKPSFPKHDIFPCYFILGKVNAGMLFNWNLLIKTFDWKKFQGSDWLKPLTYNKNYYDLEYRWHQDSMKIYWQMRDKREYTDEYDVRTFNVELSKCKYFRHDSIEVLYASSTDSISKFYEPSWTIVYVNGKLLDAIRDYSSISSDGYGPFFYKPQKLIGWYNTNEISALVFLPGYVIYNKNGVWRYANREAVQYFGECDCGE